MFCHEPRPLMYGDAAGKPRFVFLTVANSFRRDAERHRRKAREHMLEGRHSFAAGSLRKSERFEARAREFERRFG